MHILITGGTGFIGSKLSNYLLNKGHIITILSRNLAKRDLIDKSINIITNLSAITHDVDVIINLAGQPLNSKRWNDKVKQDIYNSRINITQSLINFIKDTPNKPKLLISGSAIGYYGSSNDKVFVESSEPVELGFNHQLCKDWEHTAMQAQEYGVKVCLLRIGLVLGKGGGLIKEMLLPFKLGLGAQIGDGGQWMSWIHIEDMISAIDFIINNSNSEGVFNFTSPENVTNREFTKKFAAALKRPSFLKLPRFIVNIIFGEVGEELLLKGQRVVPQKLIEAGYQFKFAKLESALKDIVN
ncbi:MAG: rcp [Rickettsiaceae bacterium]|jgi:uncharacterized protein (TIGR01777 family)|nr:rcp [Rickettsiaceae bacterium]